MLQNVMQTALGSINPVPDNGHTAIRSRSADPGKLFSTSRNPGKVRIHLKRSNSFINFISYGQDDIIMRSICDQLPLHIKQKHGGDIICSC